MGPRIAVCLPCESDADVTGFALPVRLLAPMRWRANALYGLHHDDGGMVDLLKDVNVA